jgi:hypothetical protein
MFDNQVAASKIGFGASPSIFVVKVSDHDAVV